MTQLSRPLVLTLCTLAVGTAPASAIPAPKLSWHACTDPAQIGLQCATA
jgi:hypothetical protein